MVHEVLYGETSRTLRHIVPAVVSSATYLIEDLTRSEDQADRTIGSGNWTAGSSLSLDDAAGRGESDPTLVPVGSTSGTQIGDPYIITAADGTYELFELVGVTSNTSLKADRKLIGSYASGDSVDLAVIEVSFPDDAGLDEEYTEQRRPMRLVLEYDVNGVKQKVQEQVRMVRFIGPGDSSPARVVQMVLKRFPRLTDRLPDNAPHILRDWAEAAVEDESQELRRRRIAVQEHLHGRDFDLTCLWNVMLTAVMNGAVPGSTGDPFEYMEAFRMNHQNARINMLGGQGADQTVDVPVQTDTATAVNSNRRRGRFELR